MSHFTVLVVANDEENLEKILQPYHEYECTGIKDEYVVFVPIDLEEARQKMDENNERYKETQPEWVHESLETFIPDYYGAEKNGAGVWGRVTNPNKRWDWWVVGGRWSGTLLLKDEATGQGTNGEAGLMSPVNTDPKRADSALAGQVDWKGMESDNTQKARNRYAKWKGLTDEDIRDAGKMHEAGFLFLEPEEREDLNTLDEQAYVEKYGRLDALTFAMIGPDGKWMERATMGWWGITYDLQAGYNEKWWEVIRALPADQRIFVVDCHI